MITDREKVSTCISTCWILERVCTCSTCI